MKKILTLLLSIVTVFSFTACDHDDFIEQHNQNNAIADNLDGIWAGTVEKTYFAHRWRSRSVEKITEYQDIDIEFYTNPYRYAQGTGREYDYTYINERTGRCEYVVCDFNFEVRKDGNIYIHYLDGHDKYEDSYIAIYNYHLNGNIFDGEFHDYRTGEFVATFKLDKVNNWRYNRGDYYMEWDWTRAGGVKTNNRKPVEFVEVKAPFKD